MSEIIFERLKVIEKKQILAGTITAAQPASNFGVLLPAVPFAIRSLCEAYTTKPQCYTGGPICLPDPVTGTYGELPG